MGLSGPRSYLTLGVLAGLVVAGLWSAQVVILRLPERDDQVALAVHLAEGQRVVWRYRHSVDHGLVEGVFAVRPAGGRPRLVLIMTRYSSPGTGLPTEAVDRTRREGAWFVVDEPGRVEGLTFRLQPVNQAVLVVGEEAIPLDFLPPGRLVRLAVETIPAWRYYLWKSAGLSWLGGEP